MKTIVTLTGTLTAFLIILAVIFLSGCARTEGAGFTNGGVQRPPACIKRIEGNVEIWGNC